MKRLDLAKQNGLVERTLPREYEMGFDLMFRSLNLVWRHANRCNPVEFVVNTRLNGLDGMGSSCLGSNMEERGILRFAKLGCHESHSLLALDHTLIETRGLPFRENHSENLQRVRIGMSDLRHMISHRQPGDLRPPAHHKPALAPLLCFNKNHGVLCRTSRSG